MDLVNNSICALDNHLSVLEGMDLDMTVLRTLRASGHALKHMSIPGGVAAIDEIMVNVEEQINEAGELAKAVSTGTLLHGDDMDPEQLMYELELLNEDEYKGNKLLPESQKMGAVTHSLAITAPTNPVTESSVHDDRERREEAVEQSAYPESLQMRADHVY